MFFPEDYPKPARPLPRALAAHVMAQAEDPANLNRWASPAYRLITVILIRCGLRISSAVTLPSGCVAADADGAPYLRYHNTKMKREALVPIDEELRAMITAQQDRNRERWPAGTPVLFPRPHSNIDGTRPVSTGTLPVGAAQLAGTMRHPRRARPARPAYPAPVAPHAGDNADQPGRPPARGPEDPRP